MISSTDIAYLRQIKQNLAIFSPDSIGLIKQTLPQARFKSNLIEVLADTRSNLLTPSLTSKHKAVKEGLISYLEEKIASFSSAEAEGDPWLLLRNHFSDFIDVSPTNISDHLHDVLQAGCLVAQHEFSLGAAAQGDEILQLRNALIKTYLPALLTLKDCPKKAELMESLKDFDELLQAMGSQLKAKSYQETLDTHKRVQTIMQESCLIAGDYIAHQSAASHQEV